VEASGPESQPVLCLPWRGKAIGHLAFADFGLLWRTQWFMAILSAACLGFFLKTAWYPVLESAARSLPDSFEFHSGSLRWPSTESRVLAENPFLGISVELDPTSVPSLTADLQLSLADRSFRIKSLLGSIQIPYPSALQLQTGRVSSTAWWGAWGWVALLGICTSATLGLLLSWWFLATLYWPASGLFSSLFRKPSRPAQSWRLGAAALLLGAGIMSLNLVLYSSFITRAPGFIAGFVLHVVTAWIAIPWGALHLPSRPKSQSKNPFQARESPPAPSTSTPDSPPRPSPRRPDNPFKS
jgi:hypothetical protein